MIDSQNTQNQAVRGGGRLPLDRILGLAKLAIKYYWHCEPSALKPRFRYPILWLFNEWAVPPEKSAEFFGICRKSYYNYMRNADAYMKLKWSRDVYMRVRAYII